MESETSDIMQELLFDAWSLQEQIRRDKGNRPFSADSYSLVL